MLAKELPIYRKTFELVKFIFELTAKYNKLYKFSLGTQTCTIGTKLLLYIQEANRTEDSNIRLHNLKEYQKYLEVCESLLSLAFDCGQIGLKKWAILCKLLDNLGKQSTGWRKSIL